MRPRLFGLIVAVASCIVAASPADALICYVIYNRSETVIYQSSYPPVDMSNAGAPQRDAMRSRGEHMTFGDVLDCPTVVFLIGAGGTMDLRVDEVVAGMQVGNLPGSPPTGMISRAPIGAPTPAPGAAAPAPAAAPKSTKGAY